MGYVFETLSTDQQRCKSLVCFHSGFFMLLTVHSHRGVHNTRTGRTEITGYIFRMLYEVSTTAHQMEVREPEFLFGHLIQALRLRHIKGLCRL